MAMALGMYNRLSSINFTVGVVRASAGLSIAPKETRGKSAVLVRYSFST